MQSTFRVGFCAPMVTVYVASLIDRKGQKFSSCGVCTLLKITRVKSLCRQAAQWILLMDRGVLVAMPPSRLQH